MNKDIEKKIEQLNKNEAPDNNDYSLLLKKIDFDIDKDFLEFIKNHNGAEGNIGSNRYILFWNTEQLISLNPYYEDDTKCEELFFFGTDGSNLGYAFDKKNKKIVSIDFLDISQIQSDIIADTFLSFLNVLSNN
jgi:hypothetical protein